jgi:hypothetical protein
MFYRQSVRAPVLGVFSMAVDDDDFPISYLFYILAAIAVMGFLAIGGFFLLFR